MLESTTIIEATVQFSGQPLIAPLFLSSGRISILTEATASVTVRVGGRQATGRGSIYLSDVWAWPDRVLSHEQRDASLRDISVGIARELPRLCGGRPAHPLELGLRLHAGICHGSASPVPVLARAMCASPFDAAIHDAAGLALGKSAFHFYENPAALPSAEPYFEMPAWKAVRQALIRPRMRLKAWCVVGMDDGPEQLAPWVGERGYRCLKIKLPGRDSAADAERTGEVWRMARRLGGGDVILSVDTNEANPDAGSVLDYLLELRARHPRAYEALAYLEQPTGRDIGASAYDWRPVAALKPVMLDEGLTGPEKMPLARQQGWSGFALKTCKGHSFALIAAAWARANGLALSLQDLTNPGLSMIHAAWLAAHLDTINGVELNSPQFTPRANAPWLERLPGLFDPHGGVHLLPETVPAGLGSQA